ncbi:MAG TPA: hypothetical protein VMN36_04175 [Verrucomicrobiales bacterium]|nr:hypothetical protein [Verrucomicrobiales bacterium]
MPVKALEHARSSLLYFVKPSMPVWIAGACLMTGVGRDPLAAQEFSGKVVLENFQTKAPGPLEPIVVWKWTPEQTAAASTYSSRAIREDANTGNRYLEVSMEPDIPAALFTGPFDGFAVFSLGDGLLPPTADLVRFRVWVMQGVCSLSVGSPTVYFGNSDAFTRPVELEEGGDWVTVAMPLNRDLVRNFRRAGFSLQATTIHYSRWIQEPMSLILVRPGVPVRLGIDDVELVSLGEGRPWPQFAPTQVEKLSVIAGFEAPIDFSRAFTFTHFGSDYLASWNELDPHYDPPRLSVVAVEPDGTGKALEIRHRGVEERSFTGIRGFAPAAANAVEFRMRVEHPGGLAQQSIDFLAYAAPAAERGDFPWEALSYPPPDPVGNGFDYDFSQQRLGSLSHAFYHARRALPRGEWTTVIIPFSDFASAYGAGDLKSRHLGQELLRGEEIFAVGLTPSYRQRSAESRILIDSIAFVRTPGTPSSLRSFAQPNWSYGPATPQPFDLWLEQWFPLNTLADLSLEPTSWGRAADPDGDGLENFREHALGLSPLNPNAKPPVDGFLLEDDGIWYPALRFRRDPAARDVRYVVRVGSTLDRWQAGHSYEGEQVFPGAGLTEETGRETEDSGFEWLTVRSTNPVGAADPPRGFLRLDVERVVAP